ncbi:MAG: SLC13 family permease [Verrucomicrobiales bacterium]|nr:SLC13 family permease [Verrucomicrobiales bacterium]
MSRPIDRVKIADMGESIRTSNRAPASKRIGFWFGIVTFLLLVFFSGIEGENAVIGRMAAVAMLMAIWWITDAIPLAATSLVPLVLFPALGIMKGKEVAPVYVNYIIFLFIGGFLIALAMERWNLHRRIALRIVSLVGTKPSRLVLGFMLATAFLSMWISNTATAIMMLAIGLAVIKQTEESFGVEKTANLSVALLLGIAYSASIGGMATLVGTPPNLALVRIFELSFPAAHEAGYILSFGQWMLFGLPLSLVLLGIVWAVLTRVVFPSSNDLEIAPEILEDEKRSLGKMGFEEKVVAGVFAATAFLWVFRRDLTLGSFSIPGWSGFLPFGSFIDDGTIAVSMALVLFLIPAKKKDGETESHGTILDGGVFRKIPWHIILLFGGGFALAKGFQTSGLSEWVGNHFTSLEGSPTWLIVVSICTGITFLTELTSNTATTEMILPLLAAIATAAKIHPLLLMIPAAVAASCAFMMPVATPPNAIIFASGKIRIAQMVKAGIIINLLSIAVVTIVFLLLGPSVFQIEPGMLPEWAIKP